MMTLTLRRPSPDSKEKEDQRQIETINEIAIDRFKEELWLIISYFIHFEFFIDRHFSFVSCD